MFITMFDRFSYNGSTPLIITFDTDIYITFIPAKQAIADKTMGIDGRTANLF